MAERPPSSPAVLCSAAVPRPHPSQRQQLSLPLRIQSAGALSGLKRELGDFLCTFRHDTTDVYFFNYDRPLEVILFCFVLLDAFATKRSDRRMSFFFLFLFDATIYEKTCNDILILDTSLPALLSFALYYIFCFLHNLFSRSSSAFYFSSALHTIIPHLSIPSIQHFDH